MSKKIPSIEELTEALNERRAQLLNGDGRYCFLLGQLQLLQAQKEEQDESTE